MVAENEEPLEQFMSRALTPEQRKQGFTVWEDDDFSYLKHHGQVVAQWKGDTGTVKVIRSYCDILMKKENRTWLRIFAS